MESFLQSFKKLSPVLYSIKMPNSDFFLCIGVLFVALVESRMLDKCMKSKPKYTMNIVLLEDQTSDWSLRFVKVAVLQAIEADWQLNIAAGTETCIYF